MEGFNAANSIRLIAADIVYKLYVAKSVTQLELLKSQIDGCLDSIRGGSAASERALQYTDKLALEELHTLIDCIEQGNTLNGLDEIDGANMGTLGQVLFEFFQHHEVIRKRLEDWETAFARKNPPRHFDQ